jgi:integrase
LRPEKPEAYLFSPREAVEDRNARQRAERRTPLTPSQRARRRKRAPRRAPGDYYRATSYAHAVSRACRKAGVKFRPYGLRHGRKMAIERAEGADAARAVLGQKSIQATALYGKQDVGRASEVMARLG